MQNRDMAQVIAQRDDSIHSKQQQLEDRARECSILSKQLEQVLEDAQRQVCVCRTDSHTLCFLVSFLGHAGPKVSLFCFASRLGRAMSGLYLKKSPLSRRLWIWKAS